MDNAPVHWELNCVEALSLFCDSHQINLRFLPKYSPELNPCELAFNVIKSHLRHRRDFRFPLWFDTCVALGKLNHLKFIQFYKKCVYDIFKTFNL